MAANIICLNSLLWVLWEWVLGLCLILSLSVRILRVSTNEDSLIYLSISLKQSFCGNFRMAWDVCYISWPPGGCRQKHIGMSSPYFFKPFTFMVAFGVGNFYRTGMDHLWLCSRGFKMSDKWNLMIDSLWTFSSFLLGNVRLFLIT